MQAQLNSAHRTYSYILGFGPSPVSSALIFDSQSRLTLIVLLDSSAPRGALRHYFDRPGTVIAACHYGTDNEVLAYDEALAEVEEPVEVEDPADVEDLADVEDSLEDRDPCIRIDQNEYVINIWDNILPQVDKQAQLITLNY